MRGFINRTELPPKEMFEGISEELEQYKSYDLDAITSSCFDLVKERGNIDEIIHSQALLERYANHVFARFSNLTSRYTNFVSYYNSINSKTSKT